MSGVAVQTLIAGMLLISYTDGVVFSFCSPQASSQSLTSVTLHTTQYPHWAQEDACACSLSPAATKTTFSYSLLIHGQTTSTPAACGPLVLLKSSRNGLFACDSPDQYHGSMSLEVGDAIRFHLYNTGANNVKSIIEVRADEGFKLECGAQPHPYNLTTCPCSQHSPSMPSAGYVGETPLKNRLAAGFIAAIVFLVIFGTIMVAHWFYKKRKLQQEGALVKKGESKAVNAAVNPAYDQGSERGSTYLYDEIDPVTGRVRIRIEPDPALKLTPQTSSVFGEYNGIKGSKDSGMYSLANRGLSHVDSEISPYASTTSVRTSTSQPPLAGYGIEPPPSAMYEPASPGYAPVGLLAVQSDRPHQGYHPQPQPLQQPYPSQQQDNRTGPGYVPTPFTIADDLDYHVPVGSGIPYDTKPDPRLADLNIEDLYAKPLKGPRSKQQAATSPQQHMPQANVNDIDVQIPGPLYNLGDDGMDIPIPGPRESMMNNSVDSIETEV